MNKSVEIEDPFEKEWREKLLKKVATMKMKYEVKGNKIIITEKINMQDFTEKAMYAQRLSYEKNMLVEFDFNGKKCRVNQATDIELLRQDYSYGLGWNIVGPVCIKHSEYVDKEIALRKEKAEQEHRIGILKGYKDSEIISELLNRGYDVFKVNNQLITK